MRSPHYGVPPNLPKSVMWIFVAPARVNAARLMPIYFPNYHKSGI